MSYHPNGALSGMTYGNGQVFSQTQTVRQLPDRMRSALGSEVPVDLTYTYTPRGQIASINDQSPANIDQAFTYDGLGRLTAGTGPWGASTFSYDAIGNLLQRQVGTRTVALSYNAANRLSSHTDTAGTPPAPFTGTYAYDGHKRRVKQVVNGVTRYSVYDVSGGLVSIDQVGAGPTEYIRASGMVLARVAGAAMTWLHPDHLGSAVAGTGSTGSVVWRESEQPFGEDWTSVPANDNQPGYTGHVEDAATGLVYMQARYYNPLIGRFLVPDPVGFSPARPDMFNRYAYAGNDPVNSVDPDGRCATAVTPAGKFCQALANSTVRAFNNTVEAVGAIATGMDCCVPDVPLPFPDSSGPIQEVTDFVADVAPAIAGAKAASGRGPTSPSSAPATPASTLQLGPYAGRSVPATSTGRATTSQQKQLNEIMQETGCHTCGTPDAGTKSGNAIGDHQPPSALTPPGSQQQLYPHCDECSRRQAGDVTQEVLRRRKEGE